MQSTVPKNVDLDVHLEKLRRRILAGDNRACFVERETILRGLKPQAKSVPLERRYAWVFERLLAGVSTPIAQEDVLLGRVAEARSEVCPTVGDLVRDMLPSGGHLTLDWGELLESGLDAIAERAESNADRIGTSQARVFAANVRVCCDAVTSFARRYAAAARERARTLSGSARQRLLRAADSLERVPAGPARSFFDALQSVWLLHLVTSCYVGARDFGFGHADQYLLPYYERSRANGLSREAAVELMAHFLMKANEISGTATWNHDQKPIPCQSSKQYMLLAGRDGDGREQANELTMLILEAATRTRMPQPVLTVCIDPDYSKGLKNAAADATPVLGSQIHFYNDPMVQRNLRQCGVPAELAAQYTIGGCCRAEIGAVSTFVETHHSMVHWLMAALQGGSPPTGWWCGGPVDGVPEPENLATFDDLLSAFRRVGEVLLQRSVEARIAWLKERARDAPFHFESILMQGCVESCRDCNGGGPPCALHGQYFDGIATLADSLYTVKTLVFEQGRLTLRDLVRLCADDFAGHEELRDEIVTGLAKFGNDCPEVDRVAAEAAGIVLDSMEAVRVPDRYKVVGGFYSLHNHHAIGRELHATPDGRRAGEPISENQSPTYGADTEGITALLKSVARLPLERTCQGGLNVSFAGPMPPGKLLSLIDTYFAIGGLHVGFTFVGRATLEEARAQPERHRTLTVRLYGFSEYFVALSDHEQRELVERTRY